MYLFLTSLVFVVLASCVPFTANDPRNYQGRSIIAVLHFLCLTVREEMAIVDICVVVFGSIAPHLLGFDSTDALMRYILVFPLPTLTWQTVSMSSAGTMRSAVGSSKRTASPMIVA